MKRLEDILFAAAALVLFAVPMLLIALAVRLDSPGPILFRQRRIGLNDQPFEMLKFRTMRHEMADPEVARQVTPGDPRVTPLGGFLRRTSLDELPQLLHVLRGEMALVGPRPHAPGTRAGGRLFHEVVPSYSARHRIRPGLTGLAQVRGFRGATDTEDKLVRRTSSDLEYIENWSPWLDLLIVLRTVCVVLFRVNAYLSTGRVTMSPGRPDHPRATTTPTSSSWHSTARKKPSPRSARRSNRRVSPATCSSSTRVHGRRIWPRSPRRSRAARTPRWSGSTAISASPAGATSAARSAPGE